MPLPLGWGMALLLVQSMIFWHGESKVLWLSFLRAQHWQRKGWGECQHLRKEAEGFYTDLKGLGASTVLSGQSSPFEGVI